MNSNSGSKILDDAIISPPLIKNETMADIKSRSVGFAIFQDEENDDDLESPTKIQVKIQSNPHLASPLKENIPPASDKQIKQKNKIAFKPVYRKPLSSLDIAKVKGFLSTPSGTKPIQLTGLWDDTRQSKSFQKHLRSSGRNKLPLKPSIKAFSKSNLPLHMNLGLSDKHTNLENKENISPSIV